MSKDLLIDTCIWVSILKQESGYEKKAKFILENSFLGNLNINEVSLYETLYIIKKHDSSDYSKIDDLITEFIEDTSTKIYKNTIEDLKTASSIKADGGISPYDALMLTQMQNSKKPLSLVTVDQEFNKSKFTDKYDIIFLD